MTPDIALAIIGALVGVTIGLLKGEMMTNRLSKFFRERWQKVFQPLPQSDNPSE